MARKMLFQFQFRSKEKADAFVASLKRLPGAVQPQDWIHSAQVFRHRGAGKGRLWETYSVQLTAPEQATQSLQQMAQKNSALRWDFVEAVDVPGQEPDRFSNWRGQLRRGGQGRRAMYTSGARKNAGFEDKKGLPGEDDFPGYGGLPGGEDFPGYPKHKPKER